MGMRGGLVRPKAGNVEKVLVLPRLSRGSRGPRARQDRENRSNGRLGAGAGEVNPPPRRLVWSFWEVWRIGGWVPLHA